MKSNDEKQILPYVERDISWMYFNQRILLEAANPEVPLLERLTFLGIYSNNLDEFFRVRVATLNRIIEYNDKNIRKEQEIASQTLKQIGKLHNRYYQQFEETFTKIMEELKQENIFVIKETEMTPEQQEFITSFYRNRLNGSTNPVFLNGSRPLEDQNDENIYLATRLIRKDLEGKVKEKDYAVIELPTADFERFIQLPDVDEKTYLMFLDDVIRYCLPLIFVGMKYTDYEAYTFKFTKDAEMEIDSDLRTGVLQKISKGVKSRKKGEPIRFVYDQQMPKDLLKRLIERLNIDKNDTRVAGGRYHNFKDLMKFPDCNRKDLKYPVWPPIFKPELNSTESLLTLIRQKDRSLHYPFHSFDSFIRVLREAAISKEVKSIKIALYRLAKDSKVVKALICAAKNGKKVTVVIELLARFDEASNIYWSKRMQDAGIHVIFGVEGLKIHSKLVHIATRHGDIACISTGNFHEGNARMYTDYTIMTAHRHIVKEVNDVFNFIEKPYTPVNFRELLVSPNDMRKRLIALINKEIKNKEQGKDAYILAKVNHITDRLLIEKLYEASAAGIRIDLLVRGNCSLVTGIPGISENIHINGIIDRYLEHSRIFIFANGGEEKYYIGSADWMPRNLDNRIEVLVPVYNKEIQADLKKIICYGLHDTAKGRIVDGSGENLPWKEISPTLPQQPVDETKKSLFRSQEELYTEYKKNIE
ncbi:RNA degradosome polyphosphate kinase [Bacteroides sp.]|uniref:RNA degradosome polyphosphate kinase n=1 Tax=Bacteroides sp. TaxID=29523 RepID=UPI002602F9FF|nr:RNA degradosome polyphosphate kinase [Bacteroides sp.]MDD3040318.1 RNA degradosome polyphosphate kinase [Bacteroides sp.]